MSTLRRGARRMWLLVKEGRIKRNVSSRCVSTSRNIVAIEDGINGEKIFKSPFGSTTYPTIPLHEYVWENLGDWSDKIALKCGLTGRRYTYGEARDMANFVARSLLDMGFKNGDVIALVLPNLPETAISFLGAIEAGLIVTTVNPHYTADEISRQFVSSGAKGVITNAEIAPTVFKAAQHSLPSKSHFIVVDDGTESSLTSGFIPFKDLVDKGRTLPPVPPKPWTPDDVAVLPYSSGTTGLSKGVMLSHRNLVNNMIQVNASMDGDTWRTTTADFQEVIPAVLPFFHIYGMNGVMLPSIRRGTQMITLPTFTPKLFSEVLEKNKVSGLFVVPPLVLFLTADPGITKKHLEAVYFMTSGAAPIASTDVERFYEKFNIDDTQLKFNHGYGLTESSPVTFMKKPGIKKYASIGSPLCDTEARLVDPVSLKDISNPGDTGELWVRGSHVMKGYHGNEEATRETLLPDGWLKTGDLAYFDEEFDFYITDRLKELIKVKGFQVPPAELEALLRTHPDIEEAAVVGIPDDRSGELPKAFVLLRKNCTLTDNEVRNFVKGKVAEYKELKGGVAFVDSIPKNASGKIMRRLLKDRRSN